MRHSTLAAALLATLPCFTPAADAAAPQPNVVLSWFDGVPNFSIGSNIECITQNIEPTVAGYTGFTYLPPNRTHAVGEVFYTHVVLSHPGNPCVGSAVGLEIALPVGVQIATSAANPAFCFARGSQGPTLYNLGTDPAYGCPQSFPLSANGRRVAPPNSSSGTWRMAFGFWIEILIPLTATAPQSGANPIVWTINPAIGQFGQVSVGPQINNDVIFRSPLEDQNLTLALCTVTPVAAGC